MTTMLATVDPAPPLGRNLTSGSSLVRLAEVGLLVLLATWLRTFWLSAEPHMDELYHLLASQGWLAAGEPRIAHGLYERGWVFTQLVALTLSFLGQSLEVARLPSVIFGTALVALVFLWLRTTTGAVAAWLAGLLLALAPVAVEMSQIARFYALHALVFWLGVMAVWRLVEGGDRTSVRVGLGLFAGVTLLLAKHLHELTVVGVLGIGLWLALVLGPTAWRWTQAGGRSRYALALGALGLGALALLLLAQSGLVQKMWQELRYAPAWAASLQNQAHFYHIYLLGQFPLFWPATAFLAIAALAFRPRAAGLCATIFAVTFLVASLAGLKAPRYIYFTLPFLFALWGIGAQSIAARLKTALVAQADAAAGLSHGLAPRGLARNALLAGAILFTLIASGGPAQLLFHVGKGKAPEDAGRLTAEWPGLEPALRPWLDDAEVVLTSNELAALWWLGRADYLVHASRLSELTPGALEGNDPRTGLPVIATPLTVREVIACHRSGLVILDERERGPAGVPDPVRAELTASTTPVPAGLGQLALYRWRHEGPIAACASAVAQKRGTAGDA